MFSEYTGTQFAPLADQVELARLVRDNAHYKQRAHAAEAALNQIGRTEEGRQQIKAAHERLRLARLPSWLGGAR